MSNSDSYYFFNLQTQSVSTNVVSVTLTAGTLESVSSELEGASGTVGVDMQSSLLALSGSFSSSQVSAITANNSVSGSVALNAALSDPLVVFLQDPGDPMNSDTYTLAAGNTSGTFQLQVDAGGGLPRGDALAAMKQRART